MAETKNLDELEAGEFDALFEPTQEDFTVLEGKVNITLIIPDEAVMQEFAEEYLNDTLAGDKKKTEDQKGLSIATVTMTAVYKWGAQFVKGGRLSQDQFRNAVMQSTPEESKAIYLFINNAVNSWVSPIITPKKK